MTDTKTGAVERLVDDIGKGRISRAHTAAATLRALAQERDAETKRADGILAELCSMERSRDAMRAERDAARAEVERLREALRKIRDLGLGPDRGSAQWQIDTAREIARAALAAKGEA